MAEASSHSPSSPEPFSPPPGLPDVRLEVRQGDTRPLLYECVDMALLIGGLPGCDVRVPGPALAIISRSAHGVGYRKLSASESVLWNGVDQSSGRLSDGDRLTIGPVEIRLRIEMPRAARAAADLDHRLRAIEEREQQLQEQSQELETDRQIWYRRREEMEQESRLLKDFEQDLESRTNELDRREAAQRQEREALDRERQECQSQAEHVSGKNERVDTLRQELAAERRELHERYTERRNRLAGLHEAVNRAAAKIQERKRQLELDTRQVAASREALSQQLAASEARDKAREAELELARVALAAERQSIAAEKDEFAAQRGQFNERQAAREAEVTQRIQKLREDGEAIDRTRRQYEADLLRLDRWEAELEKRQEECVRLETDIADRQRAQAAGDAELRSRLDRQAILEGELEIEREQLAAAQAACAQERSRLAQEHDVRQKQLNDQLVECQTWEAELAESRPVIERQRLEIQAEQDRLTALAAGLEDRDRELYTRALALEDRYRQLQSDTAEMEQQGRELTSWQDRLEAEAQRLARDREAIEPRTTDLAQRAVTLETQQASMAALRTRFERGRQELAEEHERLAQERLRHERMENELREQMAQVEGRRLELEETERSRTDRIAKLEERSALMETAVSQMRQIKDQLDQQQAEAEARSRQLDERSIAHEQAAAELHARSLQLTRMQDALQAERQSLLAREAALAEADAARAALQDQLRKRSEQLAEQLRVVAERDARSAVLHAETEAARNALAGNVQASGERENRLSAQEAIIGRRTRRIQEVGRRMASQKRMLHEAAARLAEFEGLGIRAAELQKRLADVEVPAEAAMTHFAQLRDQLREHLNQLHGYARQSHDELDGLRTQVLAEAEQARKEGAALARARQEHRVAVASFRQQLIDWQGQVAEMRRSLRRDETQIEKREAAVEKTSAKLARQAAALEVQERDVQERRSEMEQHLDDMRQWYRAKLRALTGRSPVAGEEATAVTDLAHALNWTDDIEPGDRQLGELLQSSGLVEGDTLAALLVQGRQQRRSLRQVLLASGYLTLYQLALIEAGNLDGLMLGPVRVMDRLRVTAREATYRVFDPRRSTGSPTAAEGYVLLRHLAEAEMNDAARPDEFRRSFTAAAAIEHPGIACTFEVLDIRSRPAAIQELVNGLPATEWPALVANPDVWLALVRQAAEALQAVHEAGLIHGHLEPSHCILTTEGVLKIVGVGEPPWLAGADAALGVEQPEASAAADLEALHRMAAGWARASTPARKGRKVKNARNQDFLDDSPRYASAKELLQALANVQAAAMPTCEAWTHLLAYVSDRVTPPALRQSA